MNAIAPPIPLIPENAPFSPPQRAWLNGFLAGLYGGAHTPLVPLSPGPAAMPEPEEFPWHDPALEMAERLDLAQGRPPARRLMAAMAQLDCGQCGYRCQTYAEALAEGRESSTSLCVPGGKPTAKMLKQLLAELGGGATPAPAKETAAPRAPAGVPVRVLSAEPLTRPGSGKDVRHVVIDLAGSGLTYLPGDSGSVAVANDPDLVAATLAVLGASGEEPVPCPDGAHRPLREAFTWSLDIA
ncbi:MAG: sulfite reductase subunit alpha, partial [Alphaproteobacteria bacterium]|nr:sulfite reductase subunit alpha [Alphaproteobacteria bacterium]